MIIYSIIILLLSNSVNNRRDSTILYSRTSLLILINVFLIFFFNTHIEYIKYNSITLYNGLLNLENYTLIFILFIVLLTGIILTITSSYSRKLLKLEETYNDLNTINKYIKTNILNKMAEQYKIIEYPLIILFCLTGVIFLISSSDIVSIFLSIELQSYGLYLISSIYRNSESSVSAGLTYFLLGGLSSCIILLGLSLLYINSGNTSLENIYIINNISNIFTIDQTNSIINYVYTGYNAIHYSFTQYMYIQISLVIISIGLFFKISSAPFHNWSPDVYDAIPTIVTTFVAIIPKISILILLYGLVSNTNNTDEFTLSLSNIIIISSVLSLIIGSLLGLTQYRIKRLFAYSTISHLGFILLTLAINDLESTRAFFFYIIQYSISNLNAFIILITIGYTLYSYVLKNNETNIKDSNYSPIQLISQLRGYFYINPFLSISLCLTLFSFVGVPPLIGFFGKQMVLMSALNKGFIFITFIAIITSVISAIYYLLIIKIMFFEKKNYIFHEKSLSIINKLKIKKDINITNYITISSYLSFIISTLSLLIVLYMFFNKELIRLIYLLI